uniref:Uncharacterized protein n=1 Tax=Meloidogyne hapla TaxID=6305 RepID=A0A1I8BD84_MELHA
MFFLKYFPISIFIFFVVLSFEDEFLVVMAHPTHLSQPGLQVENDMEFFFNFVIIKLTKRK